MEEISAAKKQKTIADAGEGLSKKQQKRKKGSKVVQAEDDTSTEDQTAPRSSKRFNSN